MIEFQSHSVVTSRGTSAISASLRLAWVIVTCDSSKERWNQSLGDTRSTGQALERVHTHRGTGRTGVVAAAAAKVSTKDLKTSLH